MQYHSRMALLTLALCIACDGTAESGHDRSVGDAPTDPIAVSPTTPTSEAAPPEGLSTGGATMQANRTDYEKIVVGAESDVTPVSLCMLVRHPQWAGQGLYVVESLTGYTEDSVSTPGERQAVTYVKLVLAEGWYQAESRPEARIAGGPTDDGKQVMWSVGLKVGETVGLLLGDARADNRGFYDLLPLGVFGQRADGGYTNGQLFTKQRVDARELGNLVKGLAGEALGDPCPYDEQPDDSPPPSPDPEGISDPVPDNAVPDSVP